MIIDSSAMVAIMLGEPERPLMVTAMAEQPSRLSTATYVECGVVLDRRLGQVVARKLDALLSQFDVRFEPVTEEQARVARAAYRDFGRGSGHLAGLNLGDCFSYALASVTGEPLLYKGDDFGHTDIRSALA